MTEVSVITVSMDRPDLLRDCLDGIRAHTSVSYEVLVVAYLFRPENLAWLREHYPWVKIIESRQTRGFAENNNLALRQAEGRYCFFVNDDTRMDGPVIDRLVEDLERLGDHAAAVSPRIVFPDGRVQTCGRAPWTMGRYMRHYLHLVDETRPGRWSMKEGLFQSWTLNGACFLIRTDAMRRSGGFDERFMFTPEDIALGQLLNESGQTVWTDADQRITHLAGGSVSRMEAAIKPARVRGAVLYYTGDRGLARVTLCAFIWCVELLRQLRWAFADRKDPASRASVLYRSARNVRKSVFSRQSAKTIFLQFLDKS